VLVLEFIAAHPWVSLLVVLPLILATGSAVAAVVRAPFKERVKVAIAAARRGTCPRCDGTGYDLDELNRIAAKGGRR
jgi:hypothetical protein